MYELSYEDREKLDAMVASNEFQLAASTILLYRTLSEEEVDQPTVDMIDKFFVCDHYFEPFAQTDNSYDDRLSRYIMCVHCKVVVAFDFNRDGVINKSIIVNDKIYADF